MFKYIFFFIPWWLNQLLKSMSNVINNKYNIINMYINININININKNSNYYFH